ncbi:MAG: hypothetical protein AAF602_09085 [Myxococcota bacterium]
MKPLKSKPGRAVAARKRGLLQFATPEIRRRARDQEEDATSRRPALTINLERVWIGKDLDRFLQGRGEFALATQVTDGRELIGNSSRSLGMGEDGVWTGVRRYSDLLATNEQSVQLASFDQPAPLDRVEIEFALFERDDPAEVKALFRHLRNIGKVLDERYAGGAAPWKAIDEALDVVDMVAEMDRSDVAIESRIPLPAWKGFRVGEFLRVKGKDRTRAEDFFAILSVQPTAHLKPGEQDGRVWQAWDLGQQNAVFTRLGVIDIPEPGVLSTYCAGCSLLFQRRGRGSNGDFGARSGVHTQDVQAGKYQVTQVGAGRARLQYLHYSPDGGAINYHTLGG